MALLNCKHVIAAHTPPPNTSWRPSQRIPYELARAKKAGSVISRQAAGWFHPQVHPPESRGEYVLLADLCGSDADVERWLRSHAHRPIVAKAYHGAGTPNSLPETILSVPDQRKEWSEVPRLALRYLRLGHPEAKLIDTLTFAAVREDLDFHNLQVLGAGFTQAEEWPPTSAERELLYAAWERGTFAQEGGSALSCT